MKLTFYVRWLLKINPATKSSYDIIGLCFANLIFQFCLKTKNTLAVLEKLPFSNSSQHCTKNEVLYQGFRQ